MRGRRMVVNIATAIAMSLALIVFDIEKASAQVVATWVGDGSDSYWSTPENWDLGDDSVPANDKTTTYHVVIPSGFSVQFDMEEATEVTHFELSSGSTLTFALGASLTVLEDATIGGVISNASGHFQATSTTASFSGNKSRLTTSTDGLTSFAGTTYSSTGLNTQYADYLLFQADGEDTVLDLPSLQYLNAGFNDGRSDRFTRQRIEATLGGTLRLTSLQEITGPHQSDDRLDVIIGGGGVIEFPELTTVASASGGYTRFSVDGACNLPALESTSRVRFDLEEGALVDAPSLLSHDIGDITVREGAELRADELLNCTTATISVQPNALFYAPNLIDIQACVLELESPLAEFETGMLSAIDNARISLSGGAEFDSFAAAGYDSTSLNYRYSDYLLFSAEGEGSVLDLSSVQTIDAGFDDGYGDRFTRQRIEASLGGLLRFGNLQGVTGPVRADDRLDFIISGGGVMEFPELTTVASASGGYTRFSVGGMCNLPALQSTSRVHFDLQENAVAVLPEMISHNIGNFTIREDAEVHANELLNFTNATLTLDPGGLFWAPNLVDIQASVINLYSPDQELATGFLTSIDNVRIAVSGGVTFDSIVATEYTSTGLNSQHGDYLLFSAEGADTVMDLSSLQSINAGFDDGHSGRFTRQRIMASMGSLIDLSNLQGVVGAYQSDDRIEFIADSGALVDLSSLQSVTTSNSGWTQITAAGGTVLLGDLTSVSNLKISVDGLTSLVGVLDNLLLGPGYLDLTSGGTLEVAGHYSFSQTNEARLDTQSGILVMNGDQTQLMEIGGEDLWIPVDHGLANFGFGQLVIGGEDEPTTVQLIDVIDNGNRPDSDTEALYLYGLGGPPGLRIQGGSTLIINNINVYTTVNGEWLHINTLFPPGVEAIEYDDGYIALHAAALPCDCDGDMDVDLDDYSHIYDCMTGPSMAGVGEECLCADANQDGHVDLRDFVIAQRNFDR